MTFLFEMIKLGLGNLRRHMLRSILTALGIILGVSAVITMVAVGEGTKRAALVEIERLGAKNIIVRSQKPPESQQAGGNQRSWSLKYGITRADLNLLRDNFTDVAAMVPLKSVGGQVLVGNRRKVSQAFGTTPRLAEVANLTLGRGRYLAQADLDDKAAVAVMGAELAKELFPLDDPLGNTIRIDEKVFTVVGILAPVGLSGGAGAALIGRDLNLDVHIPITAAEAMFGDTIVRRESGSFQSSEVQISEIYIVAPTRESVPDYADVIRRVMDVRHPGLTDVGLVVPYELLRTAERTALTWNIVLGAIASISLLVGGIGIMNIMLASVTERTREIGIRRALGATRRHVQLQFLIETGVLSTLGGLIGVGLGVGASVGLGAGMHWAARVPWLATYVPTDFAPPQVTVWSIGVAFVVAAATGLIFGIYPAIRAAKQDPIVALRHD